MEGFDLRLITKKSILLRGKVLGGDKPLICIPLTAKDELTLYNQIEKAIKLSPDVVEWRVDYFEESCNVHKIYEILELLKTKAKHIPIIFTCRDHMEGGFKKIEDEIRLEIMKNALESGNIDVVDIELSLGKKKIDYIKSLTVKNGVALIISCHNFKETPLEEDILSIIREEIKYGADIAKVAVMPNNHEDVLRLMKATLKARNEIDNPIITMSMGRLGAISRGAGWIFGSDLTFAVGDEASAPGQLPIKDLKMFIEILSKAMES